MHGLAATPDGRYLVAGSLSEVSSQVGNLPPKPEGMSSEEHDKHHAISPDSGEGSMGTSYVSIIGTSTQDILRRIEPKCADIATDMIESVANEIRKLDELDSHEPSNNKG